VFSRRNFLASLVTGPAAALVHPKSPVVSDRQIWVIMGVNWLHNDEYAYCEGQVLTEYAFDNPEAAKQRCAELIEDFCSKDNPDDFLPSDIDTPEGWDDWEREQKWDWLFGSTPNPPPVYKGPDDGFGWVPVPFEVCEMTLPASAEHQLKMRSSGS